MEPDLFVASARISVGEGFNAMPCGVWLAVEIMDLDIKKRID